MKLVLEERKFIKNNSEMLNRIFGKKAIELRDRVFDDRVTDKELEIRFVRELKKWLIEFKMISEEEQKEKETFI